jgi:hypothetical protein
MTGIVALETLTPELLKAFATVKTDPKYTGNTRYFGLEIAIEFK